MRPLLPEIKSQLLLITLATSISFASGQFSSQEAKKWGTPTPEVSTEIYSKAILFLDYLASLDFKSAATMFHHGFPKKQLQVQLKQTWSQNISSHGNYRELRQMSISRSEHSFHFYARTIFDKKQIGLNLDFNKNLEISRYAYLPVKKIPNIPEITVPYDRPNRYTIKHILIGPKRYSLKARLYLPNHIKNCPIVILTHDFGPQDLEHRTGINGFFKDIAKGLASNNIGCLLYPKRSYVYKAPEGQLINPSWEVLEDIYNAIFQIKTLSRTRGSNLVLLSYGFSSYFVPYLARKKLFKGYVLLNPSLRHPLDVLFEIEEFFLAKKSKSKTLENKIFNLYNRIQMVHQKKLDRDEKVLDYPASYFYSLDRFKPEVFKKNEIQEPFLSLVAKRDFASNPADYQLLKTILKESVHYSESFPMLNRIFHVGNKMNPRQDFLTPGVVSAHVIGEIIKFIKLVEQNTVKK